MDALEAVVQEIAGRVGQRVGYRHDASGTPIAVGYSHGPGGNLTFPGVDAVMFHTVMGAESLLGQLPTNPSLNTDPTFYTITGVQGDTGAEKVDACDNSPTAGLLKACLSHSVFGRYERATAELEINRLGQRIDRADPMDLALVGTPLAGAGGFGGLTETSAPVDLFRNEVTRKFWERNVSFHRLLSRQLWSGNPANNSAGGGYKELTGIQGLVRTGYVDAERGVACPAVDSYIRNFSNQRVDGANVPTVAEITNLYFQVKDRAIRTGVMPVRWAFAMRHQLFYELTRIWPCAYLSYRCQPAAGSTQFIDSSDSTKLRDAMYQGRYLLIDGEQVPVVIDDGIPENVGGDIGVPIGCFTSDIYLLPFSVAGGRSVLFMEYFQYQNPAIQDALGRMILGVIEGAFLTWPRQTNQCIVWQSKIEPRLILRTPWLAARLQNVAYCPIQHTRDSNPDETYFADGGRTSRSGPSFFELWNQ